MMLRNVVLAIALCWLAVGLWAAATMGAWAMLIFPVIVVAGIGVRTLPLSGQRDRRRAGRLAPDQRAFPRRREPGGRSSCGSTRQPANANTSTIDLAPVAQRICHGAPLLRMPQVLASSPKGESPSC